MKYQLAEAFRDIAKSHPTWVRGLKYPKFCHACLLDIVAPHVGAWIEIATMYRDRLAAIVAPHVGAWIEIVTT